MAMEIFASAALPILLEKAVSLVEEGHGLMFGVDEERKKLQSLVSTIQAVLQDAEEKQIGNRHITGWLAQLKDAVHEAEDALDDVNYEVMLRERKGKVWEIVTCCSPFSDIITNIIMVLKMKKVVGRFESISKEKEQFNFIAQNVLASGSQSGATDQSRETDAQVIEGEVVGRDEDVRKIREKLISFSEAAGGGSGSVSVLSIVGLGGLGKTTLAQKVYSDSQVEKVFEPRMWVHVSDVFNITNLLKKIIESVEEKSESGSSTLEGLRKKVAKILEGKKYLLVLDDIWNDKKEEWDKFKKYLTNGAKGSCVLVTTRSETVSSTVDPVYALSLEKLSDDDCWKLFQQKAFSEHTGEIEAYKIEIGKAIVKKYCGGLPLAASTLGSLLYHKKSEADWRSVMENEITEWKNDNILPSLWLSYKHLPQHVKPCFAFCAVFPKGHEMDREILVQLWMANGFISSDSDIEMEQKGRKIFDELISRSLFQDFNKDTDGDATCEMHDLVHDLAQSILGNECYILDNKQGHLPDKQLRHLSVTSDAQLPAITKVVHTTTEILRTLIFINDSW